MPNNDTTSDNPDTSELAIETSESTIETAPEPFSEDQADTTSGNPFSTGNTGMTSETISSNKEITPPISFTTMIDKGKEVFSLFPEKLDSSGYVILVAIALFFILILWRYTAKLNKIVLSTQKNQQALKDIALSLYVQNRVTEYRLLLLDLNTVTTAVEKINARTQLYNHLNTVSREICEIEDNALDKALAGVYFSKIHARYLKLPMLPEGIMYFKYLGKLLSEASSIDEEILLPKIKKEYKQAIKEVKEITREVIDEQASQKKPKKGWVFPFLKKIK